jgi:hypothetical protein
MRKVTITRGASVDAGTFSQLVVYAKDDVTVLLRLVCGELPARGNQHGRSCVSPMPGEPAITYLFKWLWSNGHGRNNYRAVGVLLPDGSIGPIPGSRDGVEIHSANLVGDIFKGLAAQAEGCFIPGSQFAVFPKGAAFKSFTVSSPAALVPIELTQDQRGVAASAPTVAHFESEMAQEDIAVTVLWE